MAGRTVRIAPSILSADFARLAEEVARVALTEGVAEPQETESIENLVGTMIWEPEY